jgi:glyoxylase-like metal-dependent hydrolase (beta-lactamase superfamily II)
VQVLALHRDVIVVRSAIWQTTATAIRGTDGEAFLVDSPVLPHELEALPSLLDQAGFRVVGLLATHADWDHVLGRYAFADVPLGCGTDSAARLRTGEAQRELRAFDAEHYVERAGPLQLGGVQELPVPGHLEVGDRELELHPAPGHTSDGLVVLAPWAGVLCVGDYLSPVEEPIVVDAEAYADTLERLRPLVERAETVVPGHGPPIPRESARDRLQEDLTKVRA